MRWSGLHRNTEVDRQRIYLTGVSGGGHMTMLMVGRHPQPWAAASAWVGISDLRTWHARHATGKYGLMMRKCCGGKPGDSTEVSICNIVNDRLLHGCIGHCQFPWILLPEYMMDTVVRCRFVSHSTPLI